MGGAMRKIVAALGIGTLLAFGCAGGVKGLQQSANNLGNDVADSSVTTDIADGATKAGNDVADSSVTKDVADAGNTAANDVAPDAGAPGGGKKKKKPKSKPKKPT